MPGMMGMVVLRRVERLLGGWPATSDHRSQIDAAAAIVAAASTLKIEAEKCNRSRCYLARGNSFIAVLFERECTRLCVRGR